MEPFSETTDKSGVSRINKFAYVRELLCDKARKTIEDQPHTTEGYNRAISILKDRFGKESEVVQTFVTEILDLPHIPTAIVSMVLDKLPAMRGSCTKRLRVGNMGLCTIY